MSNLIGKPSLFKGYGPEKKPKDKTIKPAPEQQTFTVKKDVSKTPLTDGLKDRNGIFSRDASRLPILDEIKVSPKSTKFDNRQKDRYNKQSQLTDSPVDIFYDKKFIKAESKGLPDKYDGITKFRDGVDVPKTNPSGRHEKSPFQKDSVDYFINKDAKGFTLDQKNSDFNNISGAVYVPTGELGKLKLVDYFKNKYALGFTKDQNSTKYTDIDNHTFLSDLSITQLGQVDFFDNEHRTGFHLRLKDTKFTGITGTQFFSSSPLTKLAVVNYFRNQDADGFTPNQFKTDFKGITGKQFFSRSPLSQLTIVDYFRNRFAFGFTPNQKLSDYIGINSVLGTYNESSDLSKQTVVNFFNNRASGARGFTKNMTESSYINLLNGQYVYPKLLSKGDRLVNVYTGNGNATFTTQLGNGSPLFDNTGFHEKLTYLDEIDREGSQLVKYADPGPLEAQYDKLNLRDDAYNRDFIAQPFILKGLQRKGGRDYLLDIQRNTSIYGDRNAIKLTRVPEDMARIGKFMGTFKGIAFAIKMTALFKTNPKKDTLAYTESTRFFNVLNLVGNVATAPFGVHLHIDGGLKYEQFEMMQLDKNRLIRLKAEVFGTKVKLKAPILTLSGPNGPNSAYGILGETIHRRWSKTDNGFNAFFDLNRYSDFIKNFPDRELEIQQQVNNENEKYNTANKYSNVGSSFVDLDLNVDVNRKVSDNKTIGDALENYVNTNGVVDSPLKRYMGLTYGNIQKAARDPKRFRDFRLLKHAQSTEDGLPLNYISDNTKTGTDYNSKNLEAHFGFPTLTPGRDLTDYIADANQRADAINVFDFSKIDNSEAIAPNGSRDMIKFFFAEAEQSRDPDSPRYNGKNNLVNTMVFRSYVSGVNVSYSPSWNGINILGRGDKQYQYESFESSLSFNFKVAALSRKEMKFLWRKLNYLASYTAPKYNSVDVYTGPIMRLTLGDLYQETPGFIESLTYNIDDEGGWEINLEEASDMHQVPKVVEVNVSYKLIYDYRPQLGGRMFSLSKRGSEFQYARDNDADWIGDNSIRNPNNEFWRKR